MHSLQPPFEADEHLTVPGQEVDSDHSHGGHGVHAPGHAFGCRHGANVDLDEVPVSWQCSTRSVKPVDSIDQPIPVLRLHSGRALSHRGHRNPSSAQRVTQSTAYLPNRSSINVPYILRSD